MPMLADHLCVFYDSTDHVLVDLRDDLVLVEDVLFHLSHEVLIHVGYLLVDVADRMVCVQLNQSQRNRASVGLIQISIDLIL